jgi:hypothetical protein
VKHHLGLGIILLPETNGALVPHDPKRSCPKRDAHGFVFAVVTTATLTIIVVAVVALTVVTTQIITALAVIADVVLWNRDNLLDCRWRDLCPNLRLKGADGGVEDGPSSSSKRHLLLGEVMETIVIVEVVGDSF